MANRRRKADETKEREERRRQILEAAAKVFARHGYHRAHTREIAAEAKIAEGTIYNYYHNKRELLLALIQQITTESMPAVLPGVPEDDFQFWITAMLRDRLAMLDRNQTLIQAVFPEMLTDKELQWDYLQQVLLPFANQFLPLTQRALQNGKLRHFNPRVILPMVIAGTVSALMFNEWVDLPIGKASSREELISELVSFLLNGLLNHDQVIS
jgi:AcrR family transcriptional regulator